MFLLFWRHSNCQAAFKLRVLDAVIRSKLVYGLETAQLNDSHLSKLDVFQLKGLRKILRMQTTFVNRANTNEKVYQEANDRLEQEGVKKRLQKFSQAYQKSRMKRFEKLMAAGPEDPARRTTFDNRLQAWNGPPGQGP